MRRVVTSLHLRPPCSLLQPRLRHSQRRVLGRNVALQPLNIALLLGDLLKFEQKIFKFELKIFKSFRGHSLGWS